MLKNIHLKNIALIKEADIDFEKGLNIMTGETGAGKSIIIGAINIALGEKANKSIIRNNSEYGTVELLFTNVSDDIINILKANDIETDDGNIGVLRKITPDSSINKINGQNVTLNTLKSITCNLIDIHGQHDHQSLLDPQRHVEFIDNFGSDSIGKLKQQLLEELNSYRKLRLAYKDFTMSEEELDKEVDLIKYEIDEIDNAGLKENEDILLEKEYKLLLNSENIIRSLRKIYICFDDANGSVTDQVSASLKECDEIIKIYPDIVSVKSSLTDIDSISKDLKHELSHLIETFQYNGERLHLIRERLDLINHLKSKYGKNINDILDYMSSRQKRLNELDNYFDNKRKLENDIYDSGRKLNIISEKLSEERKRTAALIEPLIIKNLKELNFMQSDFKVSFEKNERITKEGFDKLEFLISTNPGEPLKPLAKVASGGELSRIMLAIKSSVAEKDRIDTLIFDEIDTGISGFTAQKVAEKLYNLSLNHQIVSITHLPQIASMADNHYKIHKEVEDGSTISGITKLSDDEIIREIAKMVGGSELTPAAIENARDLKENANLFKLRE